MQQPVEALSDHGEPNLYGLAWPGALCWVLSIAHRMLFDCHLFGADLYTNSLTPLLIPLTMLLAVVALFYAVVAAFTDWPPLARVPIMAVNLSYAAMLVFFIASD